MNIVNRNTFHKYIYTNIHACNFSSLTFSVLFFSIESYYYFYIDKFQYSNFSLSTETFLENTIHDDPALLTNSK